MKPDIDPMFTMEPDLASSMCLPKARQHQKRAVEIDVDDVQPMFVGNLFGRRLASCDAGIVDEDIDAAVAGCQLIGDLGDTLRGPLRP